MELSCFRVHVYDIILAVLIIYNMILNLFFNKSGTGGGISMRIGEGVKVQKHHPIVSFNTWDR